MKTREFWIGAIKDNWYLLAALVILPVLGAFVAGRSSDDAPRDSDPSRTAEAATLADAGNGGEDDERQASPFKAPRTKQENARAAIARYERQNKENSDDQSSALNLMRMGNLYYATLHDYEQAIQKYELLISKYPDFERIKDVYPALAECYGRTNRINLQREAYRRMLDFYPEGSEHYKFAQEKLKPTI